MHQPTPVNRNHNYGAVDDIEEQIEASTILLDNGQSKPQKITIKFRKEKPSGESPSQLPFSVATPQLATSTPKPKKGKKKSHNNRMSAISETDGSSRQGEDEASTDGHYGKTRQHIDDANLLLSLSNIHSSSNDSYSCSSQGRQGVGSGSNTPQTIRKHSLQKRQPSFLQNDESYSNSEFAAMYGKYPENGHLTETNGTKRLNFSGATTTPMRHNSHNQYLSPSVAKASHRSSESSSKSSTPRNTYKTLRKNASNTSLLNQTLCDNDDSMTSFSMVEPNSFFETENDDELRQQRLDKALKTINEHLQKPHIDPFNSELCKAFLTKVGFPSREHDENYKLINTLLSKLSNTKVAMIADVRFLIEKEVGRGAYGSVYRYRNI